MIYPDDAKDFSTLMDVTWQSLGRNYVDKKTKQYWFAKLQKYQLSEVSNSFDIWLMASDELPTINDIIKGCIPKNDFYKSIGYIPDGEIKKEGLKEIDNFIAANTKPKTDYKAWAKRIKANPSKYPASSLIAAEQALN